jgi:hypothetical protein
VPDEVKIPEIQRTPDIAATTKEGHALFIELRVWHAVDEQKKEVLRKHGVATLEIDLRRFIGKLPDRAEVTAFICEQSADREWIVDSKPAQIIREAVMLYAKEHTDCPYGLGKTEISIHHIYPANCGGCPCLLVKRPSSALCTGPSGIVDRKTLKDAIDGRPVPAPDFVRDVRRERQEERHRQEQILERLKQEETRIGNTGHFRCVPPSLDLDDILDRETIVSCGIRTCVTCGRPATGYAGIGRYEGKVVFVCSCDSSHRTFIGD